MVIKKGNERQFISFDWAMKRLLRSKANFGILEGFLSELLLDDIKIQDILESESNKEDEDDKYNRVDMLVRNKKGELILIEVQYKHRSDYYHRMLYGVSKLIVEHMQKGWDYDRVKKVISVNLIYFDLGQGEDYIYKGTTNFVGRHNGVELDLLETEKTSFGKESVSGLFPEYYVIKINNFNDVAKDTLDEWIYFLKNEEIKNNFKAKGLDEAKDKLDIMKLSKKERMAHERRSENRRDINSAYNVNYKVAKVEAKLEIAKKMLENDFDIKDIKKITGLSVKAIKNQKT